MQFYRIVHKRGAKDKPTKCDRWPDGEGGPDAPWAKIARAVRRLLKDGHEKTKIAVVAVQPGGVLRDLDRAEAAKLEKIR